ncbi:AMP-binding protein [Sphingomonas sp. MMS24-JH45]
MFGDVGGAPGVDVLRPRQLAPETRRDPRRGRGQRCAPAIVTSADLAPLAAEACEGLDALSVRLAAGGSGSGFDALADAIAGYPAEASADERDGGSMIPRARPAIPKGILRALANGAFGVPNSLEAMLADTYAIDADTVYLSPAPMHTPRRSGSPYPPYKGGDCVDALDPEAVLATIARHRVTHAQFVPTHFVRMLRLPDDVRAKYDLSSLRTVIHAAAPAPRRQARDDRLAGADRRQDHRQRGLRADRDRQPRMAGHLARSGAASASPIRIVDLETGATLPPGAIGGCISRIPDPPYDKDPAKTAGARTANGWYAGRRRVARCRGGISTSPTGART